MAAQLWNVVLAAGAGRRLASVTGGIPKQFWSPDGGATLLEHTLSRSLPLTPAARTVVIVDRTHAPYIAALPRVARDCRVVYQPNDRGTAAGVFLGLVEVVSADPEAVVLLMPSDQGVRNRHAFVAGIRCAAREVQSNRSDIVLLGVAPAAAIGDYGWIMPRNSATAHGMRSVATFVEKPGPALARSLFDAGAVWNTMVLAARGTALVALYRRHLPELTDVFMPALRLDERERNAHFTAGYQTLPSADFSRDVLGPADGLALYTWPSQLGWSDLGTPERLAAWDDGRRQLAEVS